METSPLPPELRDLIDRIAAHPHGLGFLHQAYFESVAVTLGVHPFLVEAARDLLETPSGRVLMIEEVKRARDRIQQAHPGTTGAGRAPESPAVPSRDLPHDSASARSPQDPEELIRRASEHPLGLPFLWKAPPETVAVTFGVHPFVVFRARGLIKRRRKTDDLEGPAPNDS